MYCYHHNHSHYHDYTSMQCLHDFHNSESIKNSTKTNCCIGTTHYAGFSNFIKKPTLVKTLLNFVSTCYNTNVYAHT